jgi:hypothetical protein
MNSVPLGHLVENLAGLLKDSNFADATNVPGVFRKGARNEDFHKVQNLKLLMLPCSNRANVCVIVVSC